MKIVLAGGGTAGHIEPALAVARAWRLQHPKDQIEFLGTSSGLENQLVPAYPKSDNSSQIFTLSICRTNDTDSSFPSSPLDSKGRRFINRLWGICISSGIPCCPFFEDSICYP
jgi:hypothetical protein